MKLLVISHKPPYPIVDGGTFAIANFIELLLDAGIEVDIFTLETPKHALKPNVGELPLNTKVFSAFVDTKINPWKAVRHFFTTMPYNVQRFYTKSVEQKLIQHLKQNEYDIIQLESPVLFPYIDIIKANSKSKLVYRAHNLEFELFAQRAHIEKHPLKRVYLNRLSAQLKAYELQNKKHFDAINYISTRDEREAKKVISLKKSFSIALSFKSNTVINNTQNKPKSFGIIGAMNWEPNVESTTWFIENVWLKVFEKDSDATLYIAGNNMHPAIKKFDSKNGIKVLENIDKVENFYANVSAIVIPLKMGSGLKIKTIEAIRFNKLIFSTEIGLQGIEDYSKANIIRCNSAKEFIKEITTYLNQNNFNKYQNNLNVKFIEDYYSNYKNIPIVLKEYDAI